MVELRWLDGYGMMPSRGYRSLIDTAYPRMALTVLVHPRRFMAGLHFVNHCPHSGEHPESECGHDFGSYYVLIKN